MRLSKIAKEFNVGVGTLSEFLEKKFKDFESSNPNVSVTDAQYEALCKEFKKDKSFKEHADKEREMRAQVNSERRQEAKAADKAKAQAEEEAKAKARAEAKAKEEATKAVTPGDKRLQDATLKVVGHIDVEQPADSEKAKEPEITAPETKAPEETKPEVTSEKSETPAPETEAPAEKPAAPARLETPVETKAPEPEKTPEPKPEPKPAEEAKKKPNQSVWGERSKDRINNDPLPEEARNGEVFRIGSAEDQPATLNVLGNIDLDAINLSTRPKKKSKEERKKEREAKQQQTATGRRKSSAQKVDVNAEVRRANSKDEDQKKRNGGRDEKGRDRDRNREDKADNRSMADGAGRHGRKDKKNKYQLRPDVDSEDVQRNVKETISRLQNKKDKNSAKYRKDKRNAAAERAAEEASQEAEQSTVLKLTEFVTANDLASMMNVPVAQVIMTCMNVGLMVSINQRLDQETIDLVASEFGFTTEYVSEEVEAELAEEKDSEENLVSRPPIITVMGHVDHGKTKLLDYIRKTNVIAGEAGGITQHIGAYNVTLADGNRVTFLDTPGHEAFTAMRARGAKMTDIAIVIVAADDGIMPQTKEAINHAAAAGVPIVFAINKIDKPTANPNKVKEQLASMNYLVEEWGGKYQSQDISAKAGIGIDKLLEKVLLEAEMLDLKANPNRAASGSVIESTLDKGRGYVATVLVQNGTLHVGDVILAGMHFGRVKAMYNERNQKVEEAGPSTPVQVLGLDGAPTAGDHLQVLDTEQEAREIASKRDRLRREQLLRTQKLLTLDDIGERIKVGNFQELNLIVKGDVDGSVEALSDSLIKLSTPEIKVNVIHKAVGAISESDVTLAAASKAIIIGFQVRPASAAKRAADAEGVEIRIYSIIYDAIEEVKEAMEGMLVPETKEEIDGYLDVKSTFNITKVGTIAGCLVKEGKIKRTDKVRVIRDGIVIHTGELDSLKRFKDDVKEVSTNFECGLNIKDFNDVQAGDLIEAYSEIQVSRKL